MSAATVRVRSRNPGLEAGFTLIELMLSIIVLTVGILGLASAMVGMTQHQALGSAHADMVALADNRIEQLRTAASYATADTLQLGLVPGGSVTVPTAPYTATVMERGRSYVLTWAVAAGPGGTRRVTLQVAPLTDDARTPARVEQTTLIQMLN